MEDVYEKEYCGCIAMAIAMPERIVIAIALPEVYGIGGIHGLYTGREGTAGRGD